MKLRTALFFSALLCSSAFAQIPGMPDFLSATKSPLMLLERSDVAKEVKLDKAQKEEIKKLSKALQEKMEGASKGTNPNDFGAAFGAMGELNKDMEEASAKAMALLTPEQMPRFQGLRLQFNGPKLLKEAEFAKMLELTEDQQAKIKEIAGSELSRIMAGMQGGGRGAANKMKEAIKSIATDIMALLTPEQTTKYKEIEGKEFGPAKKERGY